LSKIQRQGKKSPSEFISKLITILEDPQHTRIISWTPCGKCVFLKDLAKITSEILPKYFNHSKIATLVRQLNYYGFKKLSSGTGQHIYSNPNFQKDRPDLLRNIKRERKKPSSSLDQIKMLTTQSTEESVGENITHQLKKKLETAYQVIEQLRLEQEFLWKQQKEMENSINLVGTEFTKPQAGSELLELRDEDTVFPGTSKETEFAPLPFEVSAQEPYGEMPESLDSYSSFDHKYFAPEGLQTQFQDQANEAEDFSNEDEIGDSSMNFASFEDEDQDYFN